MGRGYRQGDVFVEHVDAFPSGCGAALPCERAGHRGAHVLAEGEATGHAHWIAADGGAMMLRPPAGANPLTVGYLALRQLARLVHDEHAPIDLPPGNYRVVQQRRYAPLGLWRRAQD
jgi:hypothetical protein